MNHPIQSIGVLGGGSAGYISALFLKKHFPDVRVDVLESSRIPVIGVGEATTPAMVKFLHKTMGFPVLEFLRETRPTIKMGVKFTWGKPGDYHFNNPFGTSTPHLASYYTGDLANQSLTSLLMENNKAPLVRQGDQVHYLPVERGYAYHIDNKRFLAWMRGKLVELGCGHLDVEVSDVALDPETGSVRSLHTTDGQDLSYDLYLDCSGFGARLLRGALGVPWISYSSSLKTDSAVLGQRPNTGEIAASTEATTMNHGWLWNTPMRGEDHLGYVFSSAHCSDDEAFAELQQHCKTIVNGRVVRFRPGRHENSWVKNVVAVGNSFAFIEPIESTGLHMLLRELRHLEKALRSDKPEDEARDHYNLRVNETWDRLKWYIALLFRFNNRLDTPFWHDCRREADVSGLEEYIEFFERNGPLAYYPETLLFEELDRDLTYSVFAYDAKMAGCGRGETFFRTKPQHGSGTNYRLQLGANQQLADRCLGMRAALDYMDAHEVIFPAMEVTFANTERQSKTATESAAVL